MSDATKTSSINAQMVTLVSVSKTFYSKGQSYDDFIKSMSIPSPTVSSQDELFRKVYQYVSTNVADCDILKADNSVLSRFVVDISKNPRNQGNPSTIYTGKKWWQILINAIINTGIEIATGGTVITNIDLFP